MSAHASLATSGCQSLSLVGESVNHHASTTPTIRATAVILRHNGLTNVSVIANPTARSPATTLFASRNGASNHTAPNGLTLRSAMQIRLWLDSWRLDLRSHSHSLGRCG